jgi:hypothetical protein
VADGKESAQAIIPDGLCSRAVLEDFRLESLRKWRRRAALLVCFLAVSVLALAFLHGGFLASLRQAPFGYLGLFCAGVFFFFKWVKTVSDDYARRYKEKIYPQLAETYGLTYSREGGVPLDKVHGTPIIPPYQKYEAEDCFSGDYRGAHIHLSELNLSRECSNKALLERLFDIYEAGRLRFDDYRIAFSGLAILIELPRPSFNGHAVVVPYIDALMSKLIGDLRRAGLQSMGLVDPVFEKRYRAYATDQTEGRFLLHPAIIDRIARLENPIAKRCISVAFWRGYVLVLAPVPRECRLFEPSGLHVPVEDAKGIKALEHELRQALGLIDDLALYRPHTA